MVKGVIFDMDGLMFDSEQIYARFWRETSARYGYPIKEEHLTFLRGAIRDFQVKKFTEWFGPQVPALDIITDSLQATATHLLTYPIPHKPGLEALLTTLRDRGIPAAVATSSRRAKVDRILEREGVRPFFAQVVCGDEVPRGKPDPAIFLKAAEKLGVPPKECFVLEDSFNGIRAAHAAGAMPIMVPDMDKPTPEITALCTHVVERLDDVIPLLDVH